MSDDVLERRFPRRLLLGGGAAAAALAAVETIRPAVAEAAPASTPWRLGGNADVSTDGTNFIGPTNVAPLVFKTGRATGAAVERMRVASNGRVGVGTPSPTARLDVKATEPVALQAVTNDPSGLGVIGRGGYTGIRGDGVDFGGVFYGSGDASVGVRAEALSTGVTAIATEYGVRAEGLTAVEATGVDLGVYAEARTAVKAVGSSASSGTGVDARGSTAVNAVGATLGVWGEGNQFGVYATANGTSGTNYGILGRTSSPDGYAVYANGRLHVAGTLSKLAGSFRIDHPQDPENRWLSHSFVESPDMMNVYNGNVVLGKDGSAVVELPAYFGALNRDFRYQLTCIGGHAPVYVAAKVKDNRFAIAGGTAGLEVSWQVTGIRHDDYAKAHPIVVDTPKSGKERGTRDFVAAGSTATRFDASPRD